MKKLLVILIIFSSASISILGQTDGSNVKPSVPPISKSGLYIITEMNIGIGLGDTNRDYAKSFFGLTSSVDLGITRNLLGGIGAGISFYNGGTLIPLFLDLRYFLNIGKMSAYAFGDGGLLLNTSGSDDRKRFFLNPGLGIKYPLGKRISANLGAGLLTQTTKDKEQDSFINLKLGMTCNIGKKEAASTQGDSNSILIHF